MHCSSENVIKNGFQKVLDSFARRFTCNKKTTQILIYEFKSSFLAFVLYYYLVYYFQPLCSSNIILRHLLKFQRFY
jgi:hypothetical protein